MALLQSGWATRQRNTAVSGCAGAEIAQMFTFTLPADALEAGDIIELGVLPGNNEISDAILIADQLDDDGSAAITLDVGVMSGEVGENDPARTCGDEVFAASIVGQAGGIERVEQASAFTIEAVDKDRGIGVKIGTAAASQIEGATLRLLLKYRAV